MTFVATWQNENEFSFALAAPKVHILLLLIYASSAALGNNQTCLSLLSLAR